MPKVIDVPFGAKGHIRYNLNSGRFEVLQNEKVILYNACLEAKNRNELLTAQNYKNIKFHKEPINDGFGKGFKNVFEYKSQGLPGIEHVFYTYTGRDYFFVELILKGKNLKSNYLSPLISSFKNIGSSNSLRSLFVPFDNDAFVRYDARKFQKDIKVVSSEVGTVYDEKSGKSLTIGSIEHGVWKSAIITTAGAEENRLDAFSGYADKDVTRDQREHGYMEGNQVCSSRFLVGCFTDWRNGLEEYGKVNKLAEKPIVFNWEKPTPVGWNSWGVLQQNINYKNTTKVVDFFADSLKSFRNGDDFFIDLDSYWDNMIKGGYEGDFTELKKFADYCKSRGLQPGVYWAPFTDWGYKSGGERRAEGSDYTFGEMWTKVNGGYHDFDGARALDPTHPGTQARIKLIIGKLKDCGFKMIKIDFLGHAAIEADTFYDKNVHTGMEAYAEGMKCLIDQLDGSMLIYAAISPSLATGRYVHMRRIACDAWKTIGQTEYTLNSLNYGWWQSYLYNYIDADHVVLDNQSRGENRARVLSAVITGTFITGDDFSKNGVWSSRAKDLFQRQELLKVVANGKAFRPLYGNTGENTSEVFFKKIDGFYYFAVFNFDESNKEVNIDFDKAGLLKSKKYNSCDVFSGKPHEVLDGVGIPIPAKDAMLLKIKL
ncbi:MAG TPA: hypothetical protein VL125_07245 [Pelobium sp.]|nr:hypothetical protein [Pelobium sp.]